MQASKHKTKIPPLPQGKERLDDHAGGKTTLLEKPVRKPGFLEGKIWIADDFDVPLDDLFECLNKGE